MLIIEFRYTGSIKTFSTIYNTIHFSIIFQKCDTTDTKRLAIIRVNIKQLEKDEKDAFSITLNISEEALRFTKV